ncbi:MAG: leucyl aminopeptidase, partial [Rhizobiales bacterium]|nr:leucyl aminopeptidase [Hyphomicrobiales bacterium]
MSDAVKLGFSPLSAPSAGVLVAFCDGSIQFGPQTRSVLKAAGDLIERATQAESFKGKLGGVLDLVAPAGLPFSRLLILGVGTPAELKPKDFVRLGGIAAGRYRASAGAATVFCELPRGAMTAEQAGDIGLGLSLRSYAFDRYKTKPKDDGDAAAKGRFTIAVRDVAAARKVWRDRGAVAGGVNIARDLINEPPNVLFPEEFARRTQALKKLGVTIDVLDLKALRKLGMNALIGVGQGSRKEPRVVVMRWNGGRRGAPPVAFIGKGVTFDTGGISIKPAGGMEDMKGDMAGAACVVGLMHALAARKARVNAVGVIGITENMPDGNAQRPGDIVTSMSGQTIEIINTDAEGRLVLGDVLWYAK